MQLCLILDNIRSAHNVGALLRTAEGLGVNTIITGGITPHPRQTNDTRLPHIIKTTEKKLAKTALGAEQSLHIVHHADTVSAISSLKKSGYFIIGLEQSKGATDLASWENPKRPLALVLGHETSGLSRAVIKELDQVVMIPMKGRKESFNVASAGAMALYTIINHR
jgi:tRNA G18 (ribose-2'-O)-methylase SpoU